MNDECSRIYSDFMILSRISDFYSNISFNSGSMILQG
jgi:hypothetical protein